MAVFEITDFKAAPGRVGTDQEQISFTATGADLTYMIKKGSLRRRSDGMWVVKFAEDIPNMGLYFEFLSHNMVSLYVVYILNNIPLQRSLFAMSERAKLKLLTYLNPLSASAVFKVKIPQGQEDALTFADIPDGTLMVDFHNERSQFHRYYTKETFDSAIKPRMKSPFTNKLIAPEELIYYTAELDNTQAPFPAHEGGRRLLAKGKTRRAKRPAKRMITAS
jgi:hypothetical protein